MLTKMCLQMHDTHEYSSFPVYLCIWISDVTWQGFMDREGALVAAQSSHIILYGMKFASLKNQTLLQHFTGLDLRMKLLASFAPKITLDSIFSSHLERIL